MTPYNKHEEKLLYQAPSASTMKNCSAKPPPTKNEKQLIYNCNKEQLFQQTPPETQLKMACFSEPPLEQ